MAHLGLGDWRADGFSYRIMLVAETSRPIVTKAGIRLRPDVSLKDVRPENSAMLILPGADTWLAGENAPFVDAASRFLDAGVPVAAICGATVGLARGGLHNDLVHTSNAPQLLECEDYTGANKYRDVRAVTDGDLVTASGLASVEFAREIFVRLGFYDPSTIENWYLMFGEKDLAGFFKLTEGR